MSALFDFKDVDNMKTISFAVFVALSTVNCSFVESLECYSCNNVDNVDKCNSTVRCSSDESCFLDFSNNEFRLGCISNKNCGVLSSVSTSIVGRRATDNEENKKGQTKRQGNHCFECCSSSNVCNILLCHHLKPTSCLDDAKADCAWMNSKFNICHNVHEAKTVCLRFCGLCGLVDGNWESWSSWSKCDITCGDGLQTRLRKCSNPAPVHGGLDCPGSDTDTKQCSLDACPVLPTVAFRSHNIADISSCGVFVFTIVTLNVGNGYNNQTGIFTAPLSGTYVFTFKIHVYPGSSNYMYYRIVQNGDDIEAGFFSGHASGNQQSYQTSTVAVLKANDTVWIRCYTQNGQMYQDDNMWNSFSGYLVHN